MPLYTWMCKKCRECVDVLRKCGEYEQPPIGECPKCNEPNPEWDRIIHAPVNRWYYCDKE